jgi:hypothetical protein
MSLLLAILLTCATGIAGASIGAGILFALARWARGIEARGGRIYLLDWLMEGKKRRRKRNANEAAGTMVMDDAILER